MRLPESIKIVEVGPRDGLQNEKSVGLESKTTLVNALTRSGLKYIETGSFVSQKWVPQMADTAELFKRIERNTGVTYSALTPNIQGIDAALDVAVDEVAVFASASERFSHKNINCSITESLERFKPVIARAKTAGVKVRGYLSCVLGCPYEGAVSVEQVAIVARQLHQMGCYEISLGDTIGVGTPIATETLIKRISEDIPVTNLAVHFHDTYGQALVNIFTALQHGVVVIDSAVAGLGGCPYAGGASGNVATEDVVHLLNGLGVKSGVDLALLAYAGWEICGTLGRKPASKVSLALQSKL